MPKHAKPVKAKGKLAKALSGQQAVAAQRAQEERARQAEQDRQKAIQAKIRAGGSVGGGAAAASAKKRRISKEGAATTDQGSATGSSGISAAETQVVTRNDGVQPFRRGERVLLVGEGNFSFAHSLLLPHSTAAAAASTTAAAAVGSSSPTTTTTQSTSAPLPLVTPSLLCCTAFDSEPTAAEKYPDLASHVDALRAAGATVLFGIDATRLEDSKEVRECAGLGKGKGKGAERELGGIDDGAGFDKIVFNFPHIGQGVTDQNRNVRLNQTLLLDFYRSAALVLKRGTSRAPTAGAKAAKRSAQDVEDEAGDALPDDDGDDENYHLLDGIDDPSSSVVRLDPPPPTTRGTILLTLRTNAPYSLWLPVQLATKGPLLLPSILPAHALKGGHRALTQPSYRTVRSWAFDPARWEGYEHRRTIGFEQGRSSAKNDDLVLTARERKDKKKGQNAGFGASISSAPGVGKKEDKAPIRTWEFELVRADPEEPAGDRGWGQRAAFKKRRAQSDPDLSD